MNVSLDNIVLIQLGPLDVNATLVFTWLIMLVAVLGSWLATRRLRTGAEISQLQNLLEVVVSYARDQIGLITHQSPENYLPFIGSLFLFIALSNLLSVVPGFQPPTGSLSTTAALAGCVFIAVPVFGVAAKGLAGYLKQYLQPSPFMLPFNLISELSRTLALAVRLFGNIMSGSMIAAILLAVTPFIFPVVMQLLGLLTGIIQAYIFAVLTTVYIGAATRPKHNRQKEGKAIG